MAGTVPLTVVIPTLDEAARLADCLASVAWAGEVIVADAGSADATVAVARAAGAIVIEGAGPTHRGPTEPGDRAGESPLGPGARRR